MAKANANKGLAVNAANIILALAADGTAFCGPVVPLPENFLSLPRARPDTYG